MLESRRIINFNVLQNIVIHGTRLPAEAAVVYYSTTRLPAEASVVYCSTARLPAEATVVYYSIL